MTERIDLHGMETRWIAYRDAPLATSGERNAGQGVLDLIAEVRVLRRALEVGAARHGELVKPLAASYGRQCAVPFEPVDDSYKFAGLWEMEARAQLKEENNGM